MKICIIVDDYLPGSIKVAAKMMHELAVEFVSQGHEVMVVTPGIGIKAKYEVLDLDNVTVYRFRSGEIKNVSKVKRAINETLLSFRAWHFLKPVFKENPQDYIIYYSPTIFWGYLVGKLKKLWNVKSYLVLRDIFPQWAIDNGILKKNSIITKYFLWFEKKNYSSANTIGLMSANNLRWFSTYYKGNAKLELLYNWVADKPVTLTDKPYRKKLNIEDKVVFFYGGNIGHAQDMSQILRLAKNMQEYREAYFVLVGAGDEVELVRNTIMNENLTNITLLDPVSQDEFKKMMAEFDIGLFCLNKNHTTHNFPGKILGYLVQEMPILGSVNPGNDLKEVIEEAGAGFVVEAGNDEALLEKAVMLLDAKWRERLALRGKNLLIKEFLIYNTVSKVLLDK
ncbi:MAG: glycosyltransferase family 4 protein [Leptospiraceae bacterium]|nr:glycosyltransferase family 4 protein [Leptospiraceae bacterium]